jgi:translation initiation factor 2B subunit (eIF-2B alpha/beta/delta family)
MPDRRHALAPRLAALGLPAPSDATLDALRDIVDEGVLGASKHVALALPLIAAVATEDPDATTAWLAAAETAAFIAETRGAAAPIVANALRWQTGGVGDAPPERRAGLLAERAAAWDAAARERRAALVARAAEALAGCTAPLAFDYSSTVADVIAARAARGGLTRIVIPESRAVDGGRRYVEAFADLGVPLSVTPDAAVDYAVGLCDAVLLGAESVSRDGGVVNTIGSAPPARAAAAAGKPVYGCADLFKVGDVAAADWPAQPVRDYAFLPGGGAAPELEMVPPALVTALLTEVGPLAPADLPAAVARRG